MTPCLMAKNKRCKNNIFKTTHQGTTPVLGGVCCLQLPGFTLRCINAFLNMIQVLDVYFFISNADSYYIRLTAFFQDNLGKPEPEKQNNSGKTNLDLLEQEIVSVCTLSQITTPASHHSVFYRPDALPAAQPTASKH